MKQKFVAAVIIFLGLLTVVSLLLGLLGYS